MRLRGWVAGGRSASAGLLVLAALAVAGCTTTVSGSASSDLGAATANAAPATTAVSLPTRPTAAVVATLRRLDACALFDPAAMATAALDTGTGSPQPQATPIGPHGCHYAADATEYDSVIVEVGNDFGAVTSAPSPMPALAIGGAKAYLDDQSTSTAPTCTVYFPVGAGLAITVEAATGGQSRSKPCPMARAAAVGVVNKLANPAALQPVDPATRPLAAWDGCSLLAGILGSTASQYTLTYDGALDGCTGGPTKDGGADAPDTESRHVQVSYTSNPIGIPGSPQRQVGVVQGSVSQVGGVCLISWSAGPGGAALPAGVQVEVRNSAPNCNQAAADGAKVQQLVAGQPPTASSAQQPLLYPA